MISLIPVLMFYYGLIQSGQATPSIIRDYITVEALIVGIDPQLAQGIVKRESGFNCNAVGDSGKSYGCWQIHLPAHKTITPEQAKDPIFSTQWSLAIIKKDGCDIWSTCHDTLDDLASP